VLDRDFLTWHVRPGYRRSLIRRFISDTGSSGGNPGGELGYSTAWLAYQLRSDPTAAAAFTGTNPELVSNSNWPGSAVK
jgi:hypothetical protein